MNFFIVVDDENNEPRPSLQEEVSFVFEGPPGREALPIKLLSLFFELGLVHLSVIFLWAMIIGSRLYF